MPLFAESSIARPRSAQAAYPLDDVTFAVIDVETTGLSPARDRIVEVAISRVRADGRVEDEYASLVNPGCSAGPTFVHHITDEMLLDAPAFRDIAGDIVSRMQGAVVVAHNATFEEGFLGSEFRRAGVQLKTLPALDSLSLARKHLPTPNHRLGTCCDHLGIDLLDAHTALGDVRATAQLVGKLAATARGDDHRVGLIPGAPWSSLPIHPVADGPKRRVSKLRKGADGWMASLMSKLPITSLPQAGAAGEVYLNLMADVLSDGKLTRDEAHQLADLACSAGLSVLILEQLNQTFLESMRAQALEDGVLTVGELRQLTRAAVALGKPTWFDELEPTPSRAAVSGDRSRRPTATSNSRRLLHREASWISQQRVLVLASGVGALDLRTAVEAAGGTSCDNLTRSVTVVVVDERSLSDRRVQQALAGGAAVLPLDTAASFLGIPEPASVVAEVQTQPDPGPRIADVPQPRPMGQERLSSTLNAVSTEREARVDTAHRRDEDIVVATLIATPARTETPVKVEVVADAATPAQAQPLPPAAWYRDPTGRNDHRFWDGRRWTEHVGRAGVQAIDPLYS